MSKKETDDTTEQTGSMCVILHRERSFHNIDTRVLKSAVQKYARRAMFHPKGVWCLIELDLFAIFEIKPELHSDKKLTAKQVQQNSLRLRSNMINRLIAMMSEDVGPCNSQLPNKVYQFYQQWVKTRRERSSRKALIELYHCLANENLKRIRLLSDLKTVYNLPECPMKTDKLHQELLTNFQMNDLIKIMYGDGCHGKTANELCKLVIEHLSKKSELAFAYLSVLFKRADQTCINRELWPYLVRRSPFVESTRALAFFYKTLKHKEHYLYLYHAMAFIIYEDTIRKVDQDISDLSNFDVEQVYRDHLNKVNNIELDTFVFDRHTGAATSRTEFANEGAQVVNECKELFIEKYRTMYTQFKVMMDDDEVKKKTKKRKINESTEETVVQKRTKLNRNEVKSINGLDDEIIRLNYHIDTQPTSFVTDELSNMVHGQRRTGRHKKAVFIASDYVYKGPYLANVDGDRKKFLYNLHFTKALLLLERHLNVPDLHRSVVDWHSIIKIADTNEYYLKQKFLGTLSTSDNDYEIVSTKIETNVKVLRRGSHIHRLIELEGDDSFSQVKTKDLRLACLQHFYLRYLLNIGDSGTWNILVRRDQGQAICGIDFEEIRSEKAQKTNDQLAMLMSKVSQRQYNLYGSFTNDIVMFKNKIDASDELATTLSTSFNIDVDGMNKRIEHYANCVVKKSK